MRARSYGRAWWTFDVRGPVVVPGTACGSDSNDTQRKVLAAAVAATDPAVDYATVRQIILYANIDDTPCVVGYSGQPRQVWSIPTAEGALDSSVTFVMDLFETPISTLVHEYGHTIRGAHLDPRVCTVAGVRQPIDHGTSAGQRCVLAPPFTLDHDPLGVSVASDAPDGLHAFAMPRKLLWAWVAAGEILTPHGADADRAAALRLGDHVHRQAARGRPALHRSDLPHVVHPAGRGRLDRAGADRPGRGLHALREARLLLLPGGTRVTAP